MRVAHDGGHDGVGISVRDWGVRSAGAGGAGGGGATPDAGDRGGGTVNGDGGDGCALRIDCGAGAVALDVGDVNVGDPVVPAAFDLGLIGGGQDREQRRIAEDLVARGPALKAAMSPRATRQLGKVAGGKGQAA